jgi:hypothetical protein
VTPINKAILALIIISALLVLAAIAMPFLVGKIVLSLIAGGAGGYAYVLREKSRKSV